MPFITLPIDNLADSMLSCTSLGSARTSKSSKSSKSSPSSSSNRKYSYPPLDLFLINHENSLFDLHDILMDKFNNLGFFNKSNSKNFIELILDNIYIDDYNNYYKTETKIEEPIDFYYEYLTDDTYYI